MSFIFHYVNNSHHIFPHLYYQLMLNDKIDEEIYNALYIYAFVIKEILYYAFLGNVIKE